MDINRCAAIRTVDRGRIDLSELLDVRGFDLNADLGGGLILRPLLPAGNSGDRITSLVLRTECPLDIDKLSAFMDDLLEDHGKQLLRYKGVLNIAGEPRRLVLQGVLKLYGFDWDTGWAEGEPRESVIVFIADELPEDNSGFCADVGLNAVVVGARLPAMGVAADLNIAFLRGLSSVPACFVVADEQGCTQKGAAMKSFFFMG